MTEVRKLVVCLLGGALVTVAQMPINPVVSPRGVINAFTQQPAPTTVAPGSLIWINGLNLGPPEGFKAASMPWPTQVGDPPLEVIVNARNAPIYSAAPQRIVAQVPWEIPVGLAQVVVRKAGNTSRPARFFVANLAPSIRTQDDLGFGEAMLTGSGTQLTLSATGLGPTDPRIPNGEAGAAAPRATLRAWVGGLPASATAALSAERPGEFDIQVEIPADAQPGDVVTVQTNNVTANRTTYKHAPPVDVQFLAMPDGSGELRAIGGSDLRGSYVAVNGARTDEGCWPGYIFDFARKNARKLDDCLVAANRNAPSPFVSVQEGAAQGAFIGPAQGEAPAGVSSKLLVLNPALADPLKVDLPKPALTIGPAEGGNLTAVMPGPPPSAVTVDVSTGEVREMQIQGPGGGAGGGGGAGLNLLNLSIDLGEGINDPLSIPVTLAQNRLVMVVGNDSEKPTKAKLAVLNQRLEVVASVAFPEGYVPFVPPSQPNQPVLPGLPGMPGLPGGILIPPGGVPDAPPAGGGGAAVLLRAMRVTVAFDAPTATLYVTSAKAGGRAHALTAFSGAELTPQAIDLPEGWYLPGCAAQTELFNLELSRRFAVLGMRTLETQFKNPCPADGFILLDLAQKRLEAVALPGSGQFSTGSADEVNDYVYGFNVDNTRQGRAETLYVLDGVTASAFRMDLPPEITSFGQLAPARDLGALFGIATNRTNGDAGLVYFDLEQASGRLLPTPSGFAAVQYVGLFSSVRKVVARGTKTGTTGSQYLIYDLVNGDLTFVPNPKDAVFVGQAPAAQVAPGQGGGQGPGGQPGGGGQLPQQPQQQQIPMLQRVNLKANMVAAVCYNDKREQIGVMLFRVP